MSFKHCPNCHRKPGGFLGGSYFWVYECKDCGQLYCYKCGVADGKRCPNCGSKKAQKVDKVHA